MPSILSCTVRGCGLPLERRGRTFACRRRHAFDVAQSGYVNVLQPQDRRARAAGDSKTAVDARVRLLEAGVGRTIVKGFVDRAVGDRATESRLSPDAVVVDIGCGAGDVLAELACRQRLTAIGVDLSTAAADTAARRFPTLTWIVANADRRLPFCDQSVDLIVSFNGRRNVRECARALVWTGALIVAVPAPDDLIELREQVLGGRVLHNRINALIEEHSTRFDVADHVTLRERRTLTAEQLRDVLSSTYRGARTSAAPRVDRLSDLEVTFASEVVRFAPRPHRSLP